VKQHKLLIFLANPIGTSRISIETEAKEIEEKLYSSNDREMFEVKPILAATPDNFIEKYSATYAFYYSLFWSWK
jgi:hypothetical protein